MYSGRRRRRKRRLNVIRFALILVIILGIILAGAGTGLAVGVFRSMPNWHPQDLKLAMTTFIYDKDGQLVEGLHGEQNRIIVSLEEVPKDLQNAVIAIEDARFNRHYGVDLRAIFRAAWTNFRSGGIREGGSTITQQLAKNAFIENPERSLKRKIQEAVMAFELERTYTKQEILEHYLNVVYLGPGTYGVEAAAQYYFGKPVSELNLAESAMIAGIIQSPGTYNPLNKNSEPMAKARQTQVLNNMVNLGYIDAETAEKAAAQELEYNEAPKAKTGKYPYFIDAVIDEATKVLEEQGIKSSQIYQGGLKIYTTLDPVVQSEMERLYSDKNNFPPDGPERSVESAMVVLDHRTGEIRGVVGGRNYTTRRGFNYAIQGERQPGSTIKPLVVYAPALEQGFSPAYVLDDAPVSYPSTPKPFEPRNYDNRFRGLISMREAIRWSVNIPAVKMLHTIGVDKGYQYGRKLGLPLQDSDRNLSLALGGLTTGVSPLQMAAAYGVFANQGIYVEPHFITKILDNNGRELYSAKPLKRDVMSEQLAYLMTDMLTTVVTSGTGTNARLVRPAAGKTGTTSLPDLPGFAGKTGSRDAWYVGYTPELVAAVWMGFDPTDPNHYLRYVAGGGHPALLWKQVISTALKNEPVREFPRPSGIIYADVDAKSGLLPSDLTPNDFIVKEIFIQDMLPKSISEAWVQARICTTSGQLASAACPNVSTGIFLNRPNDPSGKAEDIKLAAPKEICALHSGPSSGLPKICTDPRHGGTPHLANIPGPGETGGCPSEYVKTPSMMPWELPTRYCDLPEHQVAPKTTTDQGGNGNNDLKNPRLSLKLETDPNDNKPFVTLNWEYRTGNNIIFSVERRTTNTTYKSIAMIKDTVYTDTSVKPGNIYQYRVLAIESDADGSKESNEVTVPIH